MTNKESTPPTSYEAWKKTRNDWGAIKPITKIIPNKKKNPVIKHKNKEQEIE